MLNQMKQKKIIQSSKNSITILQKINPTKNQKLIQKRKETNEKYKTDDIKQIYNKIFFYNSNNNHPNVSKNNDRFSHNNFMNQNKRNLNRNLIRNSLNNKTINLKNNIPFPLKKNSKEKLKIKTKIYGASYISNDLSKNNMKQTNNTTEVNISSEENNNNLTIDNNDKESKKENDNKDENIVLINLTNKSDSNNLIQKNTTKNCINKIKNINNINIFQKNNYNTNNKIINIIEKNVKCNKNNKKTNNTNSQNNKRNTEDKDFLSSLKKEESQENNKKYIDVKKSKIQVKKQFKNNIFNSLKENKPNYYYLVVCENKLKNQKSNDEINKLKKNELSMPINNHKTFNKNKVIKNMDKRDLSPKNNFFGDSSSKIKVSYKKILLVNNEEITICEDNKKSLNNLKNNSIIKNTDKSISEGKYNNNKKIIVNKKIINDNNKSNNSSNNTFFKKNKNIYNNNYKSNFLKVRDMKSKKPNSHNKFKKLGTDDNKIEQNKKENILNNNCYSNNNINFKNNEKSNIDINNSTKNNINKTFEINIRINNSNLTILDSISYENINKSNNNIISIKSKKNYSKNKQNSIADNQAKSNSNRTNKNNKKILEIKSKTKKYLNNNYFQNFLEKSNNISINNMDEDDKTDKEVEESENSSHINRLISYFNDAKKTLKNSNIFYKNKKEFLDSISPNKNSIKNEDDELLNRAIKVPKFFDVSLINNLHENVVNNNNFEIKNLYNLISKSYNFKLKNLLLSFLDDKSIMILSSINRQFYINLRNIFYENIYKKIFSEKNNTFINKLKSSLKLYASNELKNCDKIKAKQIYDSYNKKSIYNDLIIKDIDRTFPYDLNFKQKSQKYYKLYNLLTSYSNYNTSIGYAQGLNFIFANALSYFDNEEEVFIFVDGLINLFKLEKLVGENNSCLVVKIKMFSNLLSKYIPDIIKYLEEKLLTHEFFSTGWLLTLFSNVMKGKNLMITWSFMIIFGWKFFYCFVIQILLFYKEEIYKESENNLSIKMKNLLKEERFNVDIKQIIKNTLYFMSHNIIL